MLFAANRRTRSIEWRPLRRDTGRTDSQALLEELFNANLFLFPLDDERCWYRYHHLFADLLRDLLSRRGKAEMRNLHRRASAGMPKRA